MSPFPSRSAILVAAVVAAACSTDGPPDTDTLAPSLAAGGRSSGATLMRVASTDAPVLATVGGVAVSQSGYGSAMAMVPGSSRDFYLLTDRGPNIDDVPSSIKKFPVPGYAPTIYRGHIANDRLRIDETIVLRRANGLPLTGLPIPAGVCGSTLETPQDIAGNALTPDPDGLDSEGLVALADGTFWISDEYGPFLAHFGADGRQLERLSPCNGGLPSVYQLRRANRGMEGLTITPNGEWLVGIMQSPLNNPSAAGVQGVSRATRVLFKHLATGVTRDYLYLIEAGNLQGNSEILALSDTRFLVIERDGNFLFGSPAATFKRLYEFDITGATDISAAGAMGQAPIGGKTIEQATVAEILAAGIVPVSKTLRLDLLAFGYTHDKPEGLALAPGGMLFVVNDDDFAVGSGAGGTLVPKLLPPTSAPDHVSLWQFKLP